MLASVRVTPMAATPATASASSSPTLVRMGKGRLLNHILGCRHWLIEQAFLKRPGAQPVESASTSHPRHYTNYLYGRISGNFPISRVEEVLGFTASSWAVWRRERSDTMGSLMDGGLPAFS